MTGFDLSPGMVAQARERFPHLTFAVGDLTDLLRPPAAVGWGAITAWYSLVHLAGSELAPAVASLTRVLAPGGWLALALHAGAEVRHRDELWDQPVDVDFVLHDPGGRPGRGAGGRAGRRRVVPAGSVAGAEVETERLYVLGRKPAVDSRTQRSAAASPPSAPRRGIRAGR